jgi:hypothetical protein
VGRRKRRGKGERKIKVDQGGGTEKEEISSKSRRGFNFKLFWNFSRNQTERKIDIGKKICFLQTTEYI